MGFLHRYTHAIQRDGDTRDFLRNLVGFDQFLFDILLMTQIQRPYRMVTRSKLESE